jgi:hypothetical protein
MREAQQNNWQKVVSLNKKMTDFMAAYPKELAAGFMPLTFPADVAAAITTLMMVIPLLNLPDKQELQPEEK